MSRSMIGGLALFLIVQPLIIFAFDCDMISSDLVETCREIQSSSLSASDQDLLIVNLGYAESSVPDHSFVYQWNSQLAVNSPPAATPTVDGKYISNAWVSLLAAMPSVMYNGSLYEPHDFKALSAFDHDIQPPPNYFSSGYPSTSDGYCRREYALVAETSSNNVYVDGVYQGSGKIVESEISNDGTVRADYNVNADVNEDRYKWNKYCSRTQDGRCVRYSYRCRYSSSITHHDSLTVSDDLAVKVYDKPLLPEVTLIDSYSGTNQLLINRNDSVSLTTKSSSYSYNQYAFTITYSKEPYYIYTIQAVDKPQESFKNLIKVDDTLLINDLSECTIKAFNFLDTIEKSCSLDYQDINLTIATDKLKYLPNESIEVSITPSDIPVDITYANKTVKAQGKAYFTAVPSQNKIAAQYAYKRSEAIIFVSEGNKLAILWNLSVFGLINCFLYGLARKYIGGFI